MFEMFEVFGRDRYIRIGTFVWSISNLESLILIYNVGTFKFDHSIKGIPAGYDHHGTSKKN